MRTATFIKNANFLWKGDARIYKLEPPMIRESKGPIGSRECVPIRFVVVSSIPPKGTFIYETDENGRSVKWFDLGGSLQASVDHAQALRSIGYEVQEG